MTFVQRFGGLLNLNVHFHLVVPDGVFVEDGEGLRFEMLPVPTNADGTIGPDFTITSRPPSTSFLVDAGTDGEGGVVAMLPTDGSSTPYELISIDPVSHGVGRCA